MNAVVDFGRTGNLIVVAVILAVWAAILALVIWRAKKRLDDENRKEND
ncbi:MAG: hypothetical protein IJ867_06725 [Clostridia bacterium]|nr:hypothetical protein [Clostridia bacterium]